MLPTQCHDVTSASPLCNFQVHDKLAYARQQLQDIRAWVVTYGLGDANELQDTTNDPSQNNRNLYHPKYNGSRNCFWDEACHQHDNLPHALESSHEDLGGNLCSDICETSQVRQSASGKQLMPHFTPRTHGESASLSSDEFPNAPLPSNLEVKTARPSGYISHQLLPSTCPELHLLSSQANMCNQGVAEPSTKVANLDVEVPRSPATLRPRSNDLSKVPQKIDDKTSSLSLPATIPIHIENQIFGEFDVQRFLRREECVFYGGNYISKSYFEQLGGKGNVKKWHLSIKVADYNCSLGSWLRSHNILYKSGPRPRKAARICQD